MNKNETNQPKEPRTLKGDVLWLKERAGELSTWLTIGAVALTGAVAGEIGDNDATELNGSATYYAGTASEAARMVPNDGGSVQQIEDEIHDYIREHGRPSNSTIVGPAEATSNDHPLRPFDQNSGSYVESIESANTGDMVYGGKGGELDEKGGGNEYGNKGGGDDYENKGGELDHLPSKGGPAKGNDSHLPNPNKGS